LRANRLRTIWQSGGAGIHNGSPEAALRRIAKGFQFVTISSDAKLMAVGAQAVVASMQ